MQGWTTERVAVLCFRVLVLVLVLIGSHGQAGFVFNTALFRSRQAGNGGEPPDTKKTSKVPVHPSPPQPQGPAHKYQHSRLTDADARAISCSLPVSHVVLGVCASRPTAPPPPLPCCRCSPPPRATDDGNKDDASCHAAPPPPVDHTAGGSVASQCGPLCGMTDRDGFLFC